MISFYVIPYWASPRNRRLESSMIVDARKLITEDLKQKNQRACSILHKGSHR